MLEAGLRELEEVQKALEVSFTSACALLDHFGSFAASVPRTRQVLTVTPCVLLSSLSQAVEVEQAKERKALAEENQRLLHQAKAHAVEDYKKTTLPLLSSLISIHATLHPQPTGASFIPPDLPAHLQDISNEDVKSIDDMFEKLRSRNLEAFDSALEEIRSLQILVGGPGALAVSPPTANVDKSEDALNFSPTLPTSERFDEPAPTTFELPQTQAEMAHQEPIETEQIQAVFREASVEAPVIPSFIQTSEIVLAGNEQGSGVQAPEAQAIKGPSIAQQVASTADEAAQAGDEVPVSFFVFLASFFFAQGLQGD